METDLFGQTAPPPASSFAKRQAVMHRRHGTADGKRCADCVHLIRTCNGRRSYYKCARYGISRSDATDWRVNALACGLWAAKE